MGAVTRAVIKYDVLCMQKLSFSSATSEGKYLRKQSF